MSLSRSRIKEMEKRKDGQNRNQLTRPSWPPNGLAVLDMNREIPPRSSVGQLSGGVAAACCGVDCHCSATERSFWCELRERPLLRVVFSRFVRFEKHNHAACTNSVLHGAAAAAFDMDWRSIFAGSSFLPQRFL